MPNQDNNQPPIQDPYATPQTPPSEQQYYMPMPPRTDAFAITSLVLGIIAPITCYLGIIFGTIAVIFGHLSLRKIKNNPTLEGKGLAIAGLVTGYIGIAISLFFFIMVFF